MRVSDQGAFDVPDHSGRGTPVTKKMLTRGAKAFIKVLGVSMSRCLTLERCFENHFATGGQSACL